MVCGLCHREPQDHSESASGPTRCDYTSHRENCPGGFRTSCGEHLANLESVDKKTEENKEDKAVDKLAADLSALNLSPSQDPQGVINQLKLLLQQGKVPQPDQQQQQGDFPPGGHPENKNYSDVLQSLSTCSTLLTSLLLLSQKRFPSMIPLLLHLCPTNPSSHPR